MNTIQKTGWRIASLFLVAGMTFSSAAPVLASEESEETSPIDFWGQLIELSSTEAPTTIIARENPAGEFTDYTVDITSDTDFGTSAFNTTSMADWITGDSLHIIGVYNENTEVVTATVVVNASLNPATFKGLNGWISSIDEDDSTLQVQWSGVEHTVNITSNSHIVVPPTNPATISDLVIGDRVRVRLIKDSDIENEARIVIVLRRGDDILLKARTRGFSAEIDSIDEDDDGEGSLTVTLLENPHLRSGDVNNMIGEPGDVLTVTYDENTKFVRKYNGETSVSEFMEGDRIFVVGRVNDDETISARLMKDVDIWRKGVAQHVGEVTAVDTSSNTITVEPARGSGDEDKSVTIEYSSSTVFHEDGDTASESDVEVGEFIRVRGTAHLSGDTLTIMNVEDISIVDDLSDASDDVDTDEENDEEESDDDSDEAMADLVVSDIDVTSSGVLEITVENEGDLDIDSNEFGVYIYLDGELEWTYSVSTLADQDVLEAGGVTTISPQTITSDTTVEVCVDPGQVIDESDDDNNCRTETLDV